MLSTRLAKKTKARTGARRNEQGESRCFKTNHLRTCHSEPIRPVTANESGQAVAQGRLVIKNLFYKTSYQ